MGRKQGCVIKTSSNTTKTVMSHDEFVKRINKSLYFGNDFTDNDDVPYALEMSKPLAEYASELFSDSHRGYTLNRLSSVDASNVQIATPATLIMSLIYLDRLNAIDPGYVRRITPQELFIVSMMISTKFYEGYDEEIYLSDWAEYGNMMEDHLKRLEIGFLSAIEWNVYISNEDFFKKLTSIEEILARRQGLRRGWLTYTELVQMLPSFTLAKFLINNVTIIAVSYAASVMTIASALLFASQILSLERNRMHIASNIDSMNASSKVNGTAASYPATDVLTERNYHANPVFNVEDELLKLEKQYREEALRESLLTKNNEISTESRLTLPQQMHMAKINVNQKCAKHGLQYQQGQGQWFATKEEYSDYKPQPDETGKHDLELPQQHAILQNCRIYSVDDKCSGCKTNNNSTVIDLLWNFLACTEQHKSFMRLPLLWLKFK